MGYDARVISDKYDLPYKTLKLYDFPDEIENSENQAVFMSHFFYWDSEIHLEIAKDYGFKTLPTNREGTYRNYVGIDEKINRIHQYMKVLKFGYGRATDHVCEDIRNGRLSRDEGKELVREYDLQELSDYYVDDFVNYLGYTKNEFWATMERFRNRDIWEQGENGQWYIPDHLVD
jgi:hypothetical protein